MKVQLAAVPRAARPLLIGPVIAAVISCLPSRAAPRFWTRPSLTCCAATVPSAAWPLGDVLFADGDETYDLIVMLDGTAEIIQGYGQPSAALIAGYGRSPSSWARSA